MKPLTGVILGIAALLGAASLGYWLGTDSRTLPTVADQAHNPERKILYYRNPMGLADTSPVPKKDSMDMGSLPA